MAMQLTTFCWESPFQRSFSCYSHVALLLPRYLQSACCRATALPTPRPRAPYHRPRRLPRQARQAQGARQGRLEKRCVRIGRAGGGGPGQDLSSGERWKEGAIWSYGYSNSLWNSIWNEELRSYQEFPNHIVEDNNVRELHRCPRAYRQVKIIEG